MEITEEQRRVRCHECRELIRKEDAAVEDNHGRLVHLDCYEGDDGN